VIIEEAFIPANVGMQSLIGVGRARPCGWGNYFWFGDGLRMAWTRHPRCVNMWAENLKDAAIKFLHNGMVKVRLYDDGKNMWAIVIDGRIPSEWLYNKLCFTGGNLPPLPFAEDMYDVLGDPDNELERFTDPEMYHARRGQVYNKSGWITYHVDNSDPEKLVRELLDKRTADV
jgi:hypothetical protein